ncbi:Sporulation related domain-containing protein [Sphingomonas guangdongensis]|uniref:Sporulation related domain-containing protein n=1 Tax=Sphingomonas guangdongensis TaxID=1141890 RepID=A0A285R3E1_9SPHN|nr:SPOR domain-containing protein [Sphingomonas guangdongensis]SOB86877.1 Sporulation related domain-containing protein [Sphingomonas guangdongensis]
MADSLIRSGLVALTLLSLAPAAAQEIVPPPTPNADALATQMRILGSNPRDVGALLTAADLSTRLGDAPAALAFLARAQAVDPSNPRINAGRASAMVLLERPGEALRLFDAAARAGVAMEPYLSQRGLAYDLTGQPLYAQRDYRRVLQRGGDDEVVRRLALSLGISGQRDEAMALLDPLLRRSDRGAWRARACIMAMGGDVAGAQKIAGNMIPGGAGLAPFFARLAALSPADRAFAVHFGAVAPSLARANDARLAPQVAALPTRSPQPAATAPVAVASATTGQPPERRSRRERERVGRDERRGVQAAERTAIAGGSTPPASAAPVTRVASLIGSPAASTSRGTASSLAAPVTSAFRAPTAAAAAGSAPVPTATRSAQPVTAAAATIAAGGTSFTGAPIATASMPAAIAEAPRSSTVLPANAGPVSGSPILRSQPPAAATGLAGVSAAAPSFAAGRTPLPTAVASSAAPAGSISAPPGTVSLSPSGASVSDPAPRVGEATSAGTTLLAGAAPPTSMAATTAAATPLQGSATTAASTTAAATPPAASTIVAAPPGLATAPGSANIGVPIAAAPAAATPPAPVASTSASVPVSSASTTTRQGWAVIPDTAISAPRPVAVTPVRTAAVARRNTDLLASIVAGISVPASELDIAPPAPTRARTADKPVRSVAATKPDAKPAQPAKPEPKKPDPAKAEPARWFVQVAGGANAATLGRDWARLSAKSPAAFKGKTAWTTPLRATNRLLAGPFASQEAAMTFVNQLAKDGASAFAWRSEAGQKIDKLPPR